MALRQEALSPVRVALARQLKRVLADEQNEVFDRLRQRQASMAPTTCSAPTRRTPSATGERRRTPLWAAALAGARRALRHRAARSCTARSRPARCSTSLDEVTRGGHAAARAARSRSSRRRGDARRDEPLRTTYREWKGRIDELGGDLVRTAYGRAAFAVAAPPGTPVCWVVDPAGPACADDEVNVVAGAVPGGEPFPTGHRYAPGLRRLPMPPRTHPRLACRLVRIPSDLPARRPAQRRRRRISQRGRIILIASPSCCWSCSCRRGGSPASTPTTCGSTRSGSAASSRPAAGRSASGWSFTLVFAVLCDVNLWVADRVAPPPARGRRGAVPRAVPRDRRPPGVVRPHRRVAAVRLHRRHPGVEPVEGLDPLHPRRELRREGSAVRRGRRLLRLPPALPVVPDGLAVRLAGHHPDHHRRRPLPERRHPAAGAGSAGDAPGEGRTSRCSWPCWPCSGRRLLAAALRADALHPGLRRRRHLHRREGRAAGHQPALPHLAPGRRAAAGQHLAAGLAAPDHRRRALGPRGRRGRHDLPRLRAAVRGPASRVRAGAALHRAQHRGHPEGHEPRRRDRGALPGRDRSSAAAVTADQAAIARLPPVDPDIVPRPSSGSRGCGATTSSTTSTSTATSSPAASSRWCWPPAS